MIPLQNPTNFRFSDGLKGFAANLMSFDNSVLFTTIGLGLLLPLIYTILIDESKSWQISGYPLVFTQLRFVIHSFWRPFQSRCTQKCSQLMHTCEPILFLCYIDICMLNLYKSKADRHFSILPWMMLSYTKINHEIFFSTKGPRPFSLLRIEQG